MARCPPRASERGKVRLPTCQGRKVKECPAQPQPNSTRRTMLEVRSTQTDSPYVFPSETGRPYLVTSIDHLHSEVRHTLRLPKDFVIHSLRHTFGTRLGEAGADAFTIMRAMGHSSVTVSQKYVHPTPEAMERAFERLEALNQKAAQSLPEAPKRQLPTTISATLSEALPVSHSGPIAQSVRAADS